MFTNMYFLKKNWEDEEYIEEPPLCGDNCEIIYNFLDEKPSWLSRLITKLWKLNPLSSLRT
jgi:hypothetical protein